MRTIFILGLLSAAGVGCGGDSHDGSADLRVGTYNAGLAPGDVPHVPQRAPLVREMLAAEGFDLLCVQEYWETPHFTDLANDEAFTDSVRAPDVPSTAMCDPGELDPVAECVSMNCVDAMGAPFCGSMLADCAIAMCGAEVGGLMPRCLECVLGEIGEGACVDEIVVDCEGTGGGSTEPAFLFPAYDTGIVTNMPVLASESLVLDSYLVHSAVDYALVDTPLGEVHFFCSHPTSRISTREYMGEFVSWDMERSHQIDQMLAFVEEKTGGAGQTIIAGDLNAASGDDEFERILATGFSAPYLAQANARCTTCASNTFRTTGDRIIDHVLVRGIDAETSGERFATDPVTIMVGGMPVQTHLSDHYGLALDITR